MIKILQLIFKLFFSSKKVEPKQQEEVKPESIKLKYEFTITEYLMGRDVKYPINDEQTANIVKLLNKVNLIMNEFYIDTQVLKRPLTSGYRPAEINATVKGASKTSHHTRCAAIDIADSDKELANWLKLKGEGILVKYDLYIENTDITKTWVHFQIYPPRSGKRIFNP